MDNFSEKRKIKIIGNKIKKNQTYIQPNTLMTLIANNDIYPTQFFFDDNKLVDNTISKNKQLIQPTRSLSEYMAIPDLSIPLTDLMNSYDINTYEELLLYIKNLIDDNKNEFTIYRLINLYTRIFYEDLIKINNSLIKIFKIVFEKYDINEKELDVFLKKWFKNNDKNAFKINICKDVKNFLSK
jgi:hypothetical protein